MEFVKKADISFYGIDDELKNDESSVFTTRTNSSQEYLTYESRTYTTNQTSLNIVDKTYAVMNYNTNNSKIIASGNLDISFDGGNISLTDISGTQIDKSYPIIKRAGTTLNPLVWYKFDNASSLGLDTMGNHNLVNNNAVPQNSTDFIKGIGSSSYNGTTSQFLNKDNAFNLNNKDFTMCCWFKRSATNKHDYIIDLGNLGGLRQKLGFGYSNTNKLAIIITGESKYTTDNYLDKDVWVFLCVVFNNTTKNIKLYRNNVVVISETLSGAIDTTTRFRIGLHSGLQLLGLLDDLRIYEKELTEEEINELYKGRVELIATKTNKTLYANTNPYLWNDKTIDNVAYLLEAVPSTFKRNNTKKFKFALNGSIKQLRISNKSKLIIESIAIPNVLSQSYLQSKAVNNIILKMKGILNNNLYDSSTKGSGSSVIFSVPIKFNSQAYGTTHKAGNLPEFVSTEQKPRLNSDNNGYLFINPNPDYLFNFQINQSFIDNGEVEFSLVYDIGNVWKNHPDANVYVNSPQTLDLNTDKKSFESFNINFIIKDYDDDNKSVY